MVGLFFPVMVLFLLDKDLDNLQVGTAIAMYSLALVCLELPTGGLSDSIGRKRVYLMSVSVLFLSYAWIVASWSYVTLLLGIFGMGVARALSSGTIDAWFVDEFKRTEPKGDLQKALAKANTYIPLGLAIGSLVGGVLPMTLGGSLEEMFGVSIYTANILVIEIMLVAQFVMTSVLVVEIANRAHTASVLSGLKRFPEVLSSALTYGVRNRIVMALMIASLALGFGLMSIEVFWQPQLKGLLGDGGASWVFGVMAAGYFLAASAGNVLITPLCARLGRNYPKILLGLRLAMGAALIGFAFQGTVLGFAAFFMLILLMNGMSGSPHATIFNSQVPSERRSTLMSFESFIVQIGGGLGSVLFGYIAETSSIRSAWIVAGGILLVSSSAYLILSTPKNMKKLKADMCQDVASSTATRSGS
jgi:MFS family permease